MHDCYLHPDTAKLAVLEFIMENPGVDVEVLYARLKSMGLSFGVCAGALVQLLAHGVVQHRVVDRSRQLIDTLTAC